MKRAKKRRPITRYNTAWDPPPPGPEELALRCEAVRAGWSEEERLSRLRADWRPQDAQVHRAQLPPDLLGLLRLLGEGGGG